MNATTPYSKLATSNVLSMTGFSAIEQALTGAVLTVELRAVNHRYLELQLKLDDRCRQYEAQVREQLNAKLGRGKVECRINLIPQMMSANKSQLNHTFLKQVVEMTQVAQQYFPQSQPINLLELLSMPGVMMTSGVDLSEDDLQNAIEQALAQALQQLIETRAREGEKLKELIMARLNEVEKLVQKIKPMLPVLVKNHHERLSEKLKEVFNTSDDERIRQELVLFAQRIDVDEELTRLTAHISEVRRNLNSNGMIGKRLDFLMQELNREANTLGSKSVATETSQIAMDLKVLIEQMREQIQNIE